MYIDCERCPGRDRTCGDCMVPVLFPTLHPDRGRAPGGPALSMHGAARSPGPPRQGDHPARPGPGDHAARPGPTGLAPSAAREAAPLDRVERGAVQVFLDLGMITPEAAGELVAVLETDLARAVG